MFDNKQSSTAIMAASIFAAKQPNTTEGAALLHKVGKEQYMKRSLLEMDNSVHEAFALWDKVADRLKSDAK